MPKRKAPQVTPIEAAASGSVQSAANDLWSALAATLKREECSSVMITAVELDAGCTTVAAQSVLGLVRNTRRTACLVEADLASPALARYLGVAPTPGLAEFLAGDVSAEDIGAIVPACSELSVVPAGAGRAPVAGEFASEALASALQSFRRDHDALVIDAPPLITHPESRVLLDAVEGVIVVVRARSTKAAALQATERLLEEQGVPLYGVIVNRYRSDMPFGLD